MFNVAREYVKYSWTPFCAIDKWFFLPSFDLKLYLTRVQFSTTSSENWLQLIILGKRLKLCPEFCWTYFVLLECKLCASFRGNTFILSAERSMIHENSSKPWRRNQRGLFARVLAETSGNILALERVRERKKQSAGYKTATGIFNLLWRVLFKYFRKDIRTEIEAIRPPPDGFHERRKVRQKEWKHTHTHTQRTPWLWFVPRGGYGNWVVKEGEQSYSTSFKLQVLQSTNRLGGRCGRLPSVGAGGRYPGRAWKGSWAQTGEDLHISITCLTGGWLRTWKTGL